ncbi:MAG: F0F1 ATP synthase subunit delta [Acidiferrobacterales bacterium]
MTERRTIARPYATAAFRVALEDDRFDSWSEALGFMAAVSRDNLMNSVLADRTRTRDDVTELFIAVCSDRIDEKNRNFIRIAAQNRRLPLLPEIYAMYEELRAEYERRVNAQVISAFPLSSAHRNRITSVMRARFGKEIKLEWGTNPALLGGIVVRSRDMVIDASVDGWLSEMANSLVQ